MPGARLFPAAALVAAAVAAAAACGSGSSGTAHPRTSPAKTVTRTVTPPPASPSRTPPPASPSRTPPPASPTQPGHSATRDASAVVTAYFDAINAHDYRTAWDVGGKNLSPSYAAFVQGFATTALDSVDITSAGASTVALTLTAVQTDGSVKTYAGTYTVSGGVIVSADVHGTGGSAPTSGPVPPGGFRNCTDARQHGYFDIPKSSPAYEPRLDRDHDGFACEPYDGP